MGEKKKQNPQIALAQNLVFIPFILEAQTGSGDVRHGGVDGSSPGQVGAPVWRVAVVLSTKTAAGETEIRTRVEHEVVSLNSAVIFTRRNGIHDGVCVTNVRRRREIQHKLRSHSFMGGVTWAGKKMNLREKMFDCLFFRVSNLFTDVTPSEPLLPDESPPCWAGLYCFKNITDAILAKTLASFHLFVLNVALLRLK